VIGAGDYIGAAIAKRFAAEGFTVFAGRRHGENSLRSSPTSRHGAGRSLPDHSMRGKKTT
jgi:NAD(P)-dependent dehydrogenase (short-subunit alcohol dehydrogenase family)